MPKDSRAYSCQNISVQSEFLHVARNLEITFTKDTGIMFCRWIGPQTNDDIKNSGAIILELSRKYSISKILNDNTQVVGSWFESSEWTVQVWFPSMIEAGLKNFAWIYSPDFFAMVSAKEASPDSTVVRFFDNYEDAYNWLLEPTL